MHTPPLQRVNSVKAYSPGAISRAHRRAKRGAILALLSATVFVCLAFAVATLSVAAGLQASRAGELLRGAMAVALLGFFVGSHVWMLAPFFYKKESSRRRLESVLQLRRQSLEVAAMFAEIDAQRRTVLRGEVDQVLRLHQRKRLGCPVSRMRQA